MNDLLMLALLLDGPQHGYALKKQAGLVSGQEVLHSNIVYPLLRRFVAQGWVTQRETGGERGQTRLMYALTAAGRRALHEGAARFTEADAKSEAAFRLRVGLFAILEQDARARILAARKAQLEREAAKYAAMEDRIEFDTFSGEVVRWIRDGIARELAWIGRLGRLSRQEAKHEDKRAPKPLRKTARGRRKP